MKYCTINIFFLISFISATATFSQQIIILPNPTKDIVNIEIKFTLSSGSINFDTDIEVYSITGELITKRPIYGQLPYAGNYTITDSFYLTGYSSGIYLVKVDFLGTLLVSRLILRK